jgi:hypothetical protein
MIDRDDHDPLEMVDPLEMAAKGCKATLTLGRDGMGHDATEDDFDSWVGFVAENIDSRTGLDVAVEVRSPRDVQDDAIQGSDAALEIIREAKATLWNEWCAS